MSLELRQERETINSDLKSYPPRLRKVAQYIFNSNRLLTVDDAIKELSLNRKSIYNGISNCKKKGSDFYEFLNQSFHIMLSKSKYEVGQALVREAVSDSHMDRKLFFQLTGDLKETSNINFGTLAIGINVSSIQPQDQDREKGVIDIEPVIPKGK